MNISRTFARIAVAAALAVGGARALAAPIATTLPDPTHPILSAAFNADTDTRSHSRLTSGNRFELLENGVVAFPRKLGIISTATAHVMVTAMDWHDDATGRGFADAMVARARAGVAVRAVVDGALANPLIVRRLEQGGVKVVKYNKWIFGWFGGRKNRLHEKIVCADLARATCGGMNIGDAYALGDGLNDRYHDVDLYVEGYGAGEIARRFLELYTSLDPGDAGAATLLANLGAHTQQPAPPVPAPAGGMAGWAGHGRTLVNEPDIGREYLTDYYLRVFAAARSQIVWHINNPEPVDPILGALKAAGARGVRVVVVTNSRAAYMARQGAVIGFFQDLWIRMIYRRKLRAPGIEIWEMDTPLHSKALTVDGVLASIGSYNLGESSIARNTEQVLVTHDPAAVLAVEQMFDRDLARARRVQ